MVKLIILFMLSCALVQGSVITSLLSYFSNTYQDNKSPVRHKRITSDKGRSDVGLQSGFHFRNDEFGEDPDKGFAEIIKNAQTLENSISKKATRSLNEKVPENYTKTIFVEQRVTLTKKKNDEDEVTKVPHGRNSHQSEENVNSREEKEMSLVKISSHVVPTEKTINEGSASGEEEDSPITEVSTWPKGTYGLPKSTYGCPNTYGFKWKTGFRYHDTEDDGTENQRSDFFHLAANFSEDGISHEFCIKDEPEGEGNWPNGKYCIYKRGPSCPLNLKEGFVIWDDENTDNQNDKGGALPEGQYTDDTKIYFCCSTAGNTETQISLPAKKPFFLFAYESIKCQRVLNMKSTSEFIKFDDEDHGNTDYESGFYPYGIHKFQKDHMLFLCYYEPSKRVVSYNAEPSLLANLEEEDSRNSAELDQETVRQSEEMMKAFLKATGGEEDSSAKKERTKTIIKTIKVPVSGKTSPFAVIIGIVLGSLVLGITIIIIVRIVVVKESNIPTKNVCQEHLSPDVKPIIEIEKSESTHRPNQKDDDSESEHGSVSVYTDNEDHWSDFECDEELVEDQLLPDSELKSGLELLFLKQQRHYWNHKRRHERGKDS
ncbi:uncharacterized protein LOC100213236 [Hydra vulgaris]|uniref:uncharacterized protein LOC100213236 n=1 Tax=Hydra vulgaris TaxID=6087 RepID=UPI0006410939|nr:uncharacterized protein LOC100213236 [Hydra vulgaris]XP_047125768.1 uncharacterized protein LOC100213236 [Hydra vulgaris]XP_047125769.1 uncharacterized protein LOC100213236 [Hydra vulgaris]